MCSMVELYDWMTLRWQVSAKKSQFHPSIDIGQSAQLHQIPIPKFEWEIFVHRDPGSELSLTV